VPIPEADSGLTFNQDFFAGYSPERINALYASAGTHKASSIKVAEAAKVIENTQRDVHIALINDLSMVFEKLGIDTLEVLEAAGTKWNFLPFRPGLVGGHYIGVAPYYLTYKPQAMGHHPEMILSGRRINDGMGPYVAERVIKLMTRKRIQVVDSNILIMGFTFKENCPDVRNTRVVDLVKEFQIYHSQVNIWDPWADADEVKQEYGLDIIKEPRQGAYDAIILTVGHNEFRALTPEQFRALGKDNHALFDVKHLLPKDLVDARL
jgi:UDP-N-acetyl-D-galactosamine dehydrogenase